MLHLQKLKMSLPAMADVASILEAAFGLASLYILLRRGGKRD